MTIDYDKYEYVKVGNYSNILYEYPKAEAEDRVGWDVLLHAKMQPLLHKLAMAHPDWTFVMRHGGRDVVNKCWRNSHETRVICEDEVIGEIKLDTWKNGTPFEIDCPAISAQRSRRGGAWTTKAEKAYKLVEENFRPMQLKERLLRAQQSIKSTVGSNVWGTQRRFTNVMEKLQRPLAAYVVANMNEVKQQLPTSHAADLDALLDNLTEYEHALKVNELVQHDGGTMVHVQGESHYISNNSFTDCTVVASHELPSDIAGKIGVLKAFDQDGVIVETIGLRVNKNTYFIL